MERGERRRHREHDEGKEQDEEEERRLRETIRRYERRHEREDSERPEAQREDEEKREGEEKRSINDTIRDYEKRREQEREENREKTTDEGKPEREVRDAIQDLEKQETQERKLEEAKEKELERHEKENRPASTDEGRPDREVRDAVKEVEEEEAERKRATEQKEAEREGRRQERAETADKDDYDELEKWVMERMKERGIDEQELQERWHDRFIEDVEKELEQEKQDAKEPESKREKEPSTSEGRTQEGDSSYDDGTGQMYVVKNEGSESQEAAAELATEGKEKQEPVEEPKGAAEERKETPEKSQEEAEERKDAPEKRQGPEDTASEERKPSYQESKERRTTSRQERYDPETFEKDAAPGQRASEEGIPEHSEGERGPKEAAEEQRTTEDEKEEEEVTHRRERRDRILPGYLPETREERVRRVIQEVYDSYDKDWLDLTEEEREFFKQEVRKRLQNEEDLNELLHRHEQEGLLDDEAVREEIDRYLTFRMRMREELENGREESEVIQELAQELDIDKEKAAEWASYESVPEVLWDLMARETLYQWRRLERAIEEMHYPTSIEDFRETFDDMLFNDELEYLRAWLEIRKMWVERKIVVTVHDGMERFDSDQIRDLSFRHGVAEQRIVDWLRGFVPPRLREYIERRRNELLRLSRERSVHPRGGSREVKARPFHYADIAYRSPMELERLIQDQFSGMLARKDYDQILSVAQAQARLLERIGERYEITRSELGNIARELGIDIKQAEELVFDGREPLLHKMLRYATSQSELDELANRFRVLLGDLSGPRAVEERLRQLFPQREHMNPRYHRQRSQNVIDFFRLLTDARGGTTRGISTRMGIPERLVQRYLDGVVPHYIRLAISGSANVRLDEPSRYRLRIYVPKLHGKNIDSYEELLENLREKHPEFLKRKDSAKLLSDVKVHIALIKEYAGVEFIPRGEIAAIAKRTGKSPTVIKRWLLEGAKPKFYYWLNRVSHADRQERVEGILSALNDITDMEAMVSRLTTLFYYDAILGSDMHAYNEEQARKYFGFLERYQRGDILQDIARELKLGKTTLAEWLRQGQLPTEVKLASLIPARPPRKGYRWLPLRLNHLTNAPEQFIEVPLTVTGPETVIEVLEQIQRLRSSENQERIESTELAGEFMYVLGLAVADCTFHYDVDYSARLRLFASKKYPWSRALGRGFCDILARIGFSSQRQADSERIRHGKRQVCRVWASEASPFLMWVKNVLLGLGAAAVKKEEPIDAEWVLQMPREWRVAFVQGLADGDGCASVNAFNVNIATITNHKFYCRLLRSLDIVAHIDESHVKVSRHDEIQKADQLPFFRYAKGRQDRLDEISRMCEVYAIRTRGKIPVEEIKIIVKMHTEGKSDGETAVELWRRHRIARPPKSVSYVLKRIERKSRI